MEPAWTEGEEGRERHSHSRPIIGIKRKKDEEAEKDITKQNTRVWSASAMPTSSMFRRPKAQSFPPCGR